MLNGPPLMWGLFFFILGTCIGSFVNVIFYRFPHKEQHLGMRSICPKCKHRLSWFDLVPLFSFIWLKGRCRYCKNKISIHYPLVELSLGVVYWLNFHYFHKTPLFLFLSLCLWPALVLISLFDIKSKTIPDEFVIFSLIANLFYLLIMQIFFHDTKLLQESLLGAFFLAGFFLILYLVSQGKWIGFGDVKLGVLLGLYLGFSKSLLALFLSYLLGGIISIGLVALKKKSLKSEIPFAPFLILGSFISLFWGDYLFFYLF